MSFKPAFGLTNPHFQTLYASLFRKDLHLDVEVERFYLEDGDFVESHWYHKPEKNSQQPIIILFHGLNGSYKSPYIQGVMQESKQKGFSCVVMHFRGCSGVQNNLPRAYHSGDTADAKAWIAYVAKTYPQSKLFGVGYSLGGNMLLKLVAEDAKETHLSGAISVSAPLQLDNSAHRVQKGFSKFYQYILLKDLNQALKKKFQEHNMSHYISLKEEEISDLKTFWDFDGAYTAPMHGFKDAQDYYTQCSARQYLKSITIPTLIIHALDDPFMTPAVLPSEDQCSKSITLEVSKYGGHVGFVGGTIIKPDYWLEKKIVNYFQNL